MIIKYGEICKLQGMRRTAVALKNALTSLDSLRLANLTRLEIKIIVKHIREQKEFSNNPYLKEIQPTDKPQLEQLLMKIVEWQNANPIQERPIEQAASPQPASGSFEAVQQEVKSRHADRIQIDLTGVMKEELEAKSRLLFSHPNLLVDRSPFEEPQRGIAHSFITEETFSNEVCTDSRAFCTSLSFEISQQLFESFQHEPKTHRLSLRLFSSDSKKMIPWTRHFCVEVNERPVIITEPNYYRATKMKEMEIVRGLDISAVISLGQNEVSVCFPPTINFKGLILAEICRKRSVEDITERIREYAIVEDKKNMKHACSVCGNSEDTWRCSKCKKVWYCGAQHQRDDWTKHQEFCVTLTKEQLKADEDCRWRKYREECTQRAPNGRLQLKICSNKGNVDEDGLEEGDILVSLKCPLSLERCRIPAKGKKCEHLSCFDLATYLVFSDQGGYWQCPICSIYLPSSDLSLDLDLEEIMRTLPEDVSQIRVTNNGSWEPIDSEEFKNNQNQQETPIQNAFQLSTQSKSVPIQAEMDIDGEGELTAETMKTVSANRLKSELETQTKIEHPITKSKTSEDRSLPPMICQSDVRHQSRTYQTSSSIKWTTGTASEVELLKRKYKPNAASRIADARRLHLVPTSKPLPQPQSKGKSPEDAITID